MNVFRRWLRWLRNRPATWRGHEYTLQWYVDGEPVEGGNGTSYTVRKVDAPFQMTADQSGPVHVPMLLADKFGISTSEARRSLAQGAVKVNGEPTTDLDVTGPVTEIQLGKRRHWKAA